MLGNEKLRQAYIDKLTALSGEDLRSYWEEKIVLFTREDKYGTERKTDKFNEDDEAWQKLTEAADDRKILLYNLSAGFLVRYEEKALDKIERSFKIFEENTDRICAVVSLTPDAKELGEIRPKLYEDLLSLIGSYEERKVCVFDKANVCDNNLDKISGFYGDRSYLARRCVLEKIPVLVESIEV
jgi:hypothetical protein